MKGFDYILIGPLSRGTSLITGVQLAFGLLVDKLIDEKNISVKVVNTTPDIEHKERVFGKFAWGRVAILLKVIAIAIPYIFYGKTCYLIIGSSFGGFLRDSILIWVASLTNSRIVLHLHGGGYEDFYNNMPFFIRWFIRVSLNKADCIIVLGESLREQFYFVSNRDRIKVVPNGMPEIIDKRSFQPKSLPGWDKPVEILYLSNLIPSKGYWDVLLACRILKEEGICFKCHFAGRFAQVNVASDREMFSSVQEAREAFFSTIKQVGLERDIVYHDVVVGQEKEDLLKQANIFVLPTYYEWEGQPLSIIEALATGTPVITTCHKAIPDVVQEGENGLFVEPKNPEAIAQAIKELCSDPQKYQQLSEQAYASYQDAFTVTAHIDRMMKIMLSSSKV